MGPIERSKVAKASPETIWATCFDKFNWERWDPDIAQMTDIAGPCKKGTTFEVVGKDNEFWMEGEVLKAKRAKMITFSTTLSKSKFVTKVTLKKNKNGTTKVTFVFDAHGVFGYFFTMFNEDDLKQQVKAKLYNIVRISEEEEETEEEESEEESEEEEEEEEEEEVDLEAAER